LLKAYLVPVELYIIYTYDLAEIPPVPHQDISENMEPVLKTQIKPKR